ADAQPASDVEIAERRDSCRAKLRNEGGKAFEPGAIRHGVEDLAPEMHGNALEPDAARAAGRQGKVYHLVEGNSELDPALPRRNVGMRVRRDIGIDPDADRYAPLQPLEHAGKEIQLVRRLEMNVPHPGMDGLLQLLDRLAHPAEYDGRGIETCGQGTLKLARGDDVRAGAEISQHPEDCEIAVGLDRVADPMRKGRKRGVEKAIPFPDRFGIVDIRGRADAGRNLLERYPAQMKRRAFPREPGIGK